MHGSAIHSDCGRYRFSLTRRWSEDPDWRARHGSSDRTLAWVMLNPSTADADQDDPTIRRCIKFSQRWGYGSLTVVNLFPLRATDPAELLAHYHAASRHDANDRVITEVCQGRDVMLAWGAHRAIRRRDRQVLELLGALPGATSLFTLGQTANGSPRHPLYVSGYADQQPYPPAPGSPT